ncbi:MAG: hypothetical protein LUQ62_00335 [Methanomicrobiales archaeon]|nr:hypothetical protein [Methanomicrobiales archaeon]
MLIHAGSTREQGEPVTGRTQTRGGGSLRMAFSGKGRDRTVLAILNTAFGILSAVVLLVLQGLPPLIWLAQGITAPIQWFTAAVLLAERKTLQNAAVLPLLFFGTLPMLSTGWNGLALIPQLSRLVMTVTALYILGESITGRRYREMAVGLTAGAIAVVLLALLLPWCCGG